MNSRIRISEIFGPAIQGEGPLIGKPSVFVRTGGCDFRCAWCDTLYAVLPEYRDDWMLMTASEILAEVNGLAGGKPILVTLSGGNPALQPMQELIALGRGHGHSFAVETQGSIAAPWFAELDWLVLSPKPPSAHVNTDLDTVRACIDVARGKPQCALKIVVFDDADYEFAQEVSARFPELPLYLQVGNPYPIVNANGGGSGSADTDDLAKRFQWLAGKVAEDRWFAASVLPQLHVMVWGNKRGV